MGANDVLRLFFRHTGADLFGQLSAICRFGPEALNVATLQQFAQRPWSGGIHTETDIYL
jgi:hypothetical protein